MTTVEFGSIEKKPLHTGLPEGDIIIWWPCEQPERPSDLFTRWDLRCRGCALHAWASIRDGSIGYCVSATPQATFREAVVCALIDLHGLDPARLV